MTGAVHRSDVWVVRLTPPEGDPRPSPVFVAHDAKVYATTLALHLARTWKTRIGAERWIGANGALLRAEGLTLDVGSVEGGVFVPVNELPVLAPRRVITIENGHEVETWYDANAALDPTQPHHINCPSCDGPITVGAKACPTCGART